MRLIDADTIHATITNASYDGHDDYAKMLILDFIDDAPTIDAVPVVKCKDCRWYETSRRNYPECILHCEVVEPDYFCASGEKDEP